jgi:hypothetical protein
MSRKTEGTVDWAQIANLIDKDWDRAMNQTDYGQLFDPPLRQGQISKLLNQRYTRLELEVADVLRARFGEIPRRPQQTGSAQRPRVQILRKSLRKERGA